MRVLQVFFLVDSLFDFCFQFLFFLTVGQNNFKNKILFLSLPSCFYDGYCQDLVELVICLLATFGLNSQKICCLDGGFDANFAYLCVLGNSFPQRVGQGIRLRCVLFSNRGSRRVGRPDARPYAILVTSETYATLRGYA